MAEKEVRIEINDLETCVVTGAPAKRGGRIVGVTGYHIYYWVNPFVELTQAKRDELEAGYKAKYPKAKFAEEAAAVAPEPVKGKASKSEADGNNS